MRRIQSVIVCAALGATIVSSLQVYPHELAYFNEFAGGPNSGHLHLLHSNLDWGQDLRYLDRWLKAEGLSWSDVALYERGRHGMGARLFSPAHSPQAAPRPVYVAISANRLQDWDRVLPPRSDLEPVTRVGYTLWMFRYVRPRLEKVH